VGAVIIQIEVRSLRGVGLGALVTGAVTSSPRRQPAAFAQANARATMTSRRARAPLAIG
jgi:hypothetical protein